MKLLKKINFKKILLSIMIVIMLCVTVPVQSFASFTGILTKPVCWLVISLVDVVNLFVATFTAPYTTVEILDDAFDAAAKDGGISTALDTFNNALMSPDKIFAGKVPILNANIFEATTTGSTNFATMIKQGTLAPVLKKTVANIYVLLRNMCAVIMLCLLIYTGIRILLMSASPYNQAKWKQALIDWSKGLCLLVFMHLLMYGIFYISDLLVDALTKTWGDNTIVAVIRTAFTSTSFLDGTACLLLTVMYLYATYLSLVFFIAYFKRLVWIVILIVISPVVATTYALGQKQARIFNTWFKEYIYAVLLQPFHMLIFYVLVLLPTGMLNAGGLKTMFDKNYSTMAVQIYVLISMSMIRPAEKFFMRLFGVGESSVAKQGSSESGVKTLKSIEKVVKEVAKVAAIVATGGAAAAAGGGAAAASAGAGGSSAAMASGATAGIEGAGMSGNVVPLQLTPELMEEGQNIKAEDQALADLEEASNSEDDWSENDQNALDQLKEEQQARKDEYYRKVGEHYSNQAQEGIANNALAGERVDSMPQNANNTEKESEGGSGEDAVPDSLAQRLKQRIGALGDVLGSGEMQEGMNEIRGALHEAADSLYLDGADGEWKNGVHGYDASKNNIQKGKEDKLNAFVNNKDNIQYVIQKYGYEGKDAEAQAKEKLKEAAPFVNRGVTNVQVADRMAERASQSSTPMSPDKAMRMVIKSESVINDQSKISTMAQIIAKESGRDAKSPQVQQEARGRMEEARKYVEKGQKDPEVLSRLLNIEKELGKTKASKAARSPESVMKMDKVVQKAVKDGVGKINFGDKGSSSAAAKDIEKVLNNELNRRKSGS